MRAPAGDHSLSDEELEALMQSTLVALAVLLSACMVLVVMVFEVAVVCPSCMDVVWQLLLCLQVYADVHRR